MTLETLGTLVALTEVDGIGDKRAIQLYQAFDDPDTLIDAPYEAFDEFHYVDEETHQELTTLEETVAEKTAHFEQCQDRGMRLIGYFDQEYPSALRAAHSPPVIYARGDVDLLSRPSVSFSGSREADMRARDWTTDVASSLAEDDYVIVSGGADGIDTAAHQAALDAGGKTIVVLGTGLERPYPEENEPLFDRILAEGGLLLSHQPPQTGPRRHGFLHRNKTNSALSRAIVIVATDGSGGTMAQYRDASSQDVQIFVPDPALDLAPSAGIQEIAQDDAATIIHSARDITKWDTAAESTSETESSPSDQASLDDWM